MDGLPVAVGGPVSAYAGTPGSRTAPSGGGLAVLPSSFGETLATSTARLGAGSDGVPGGNGEGVGDAPGVKARRVLEMLHRQADPPPVLTDATDLVREPEPDRDWVIPDFLERQGRVLLAGAEGCGKSLLALTLAVQAASAIPVLDFFPIGTVGRKVLYMDLEMARSSTRRRLRQLSISAKEKLEPGALDVLHRPDGLDVNSERRWLEGVLAHSQPDIVVVDPLYKLMLTDSVYERDVRPTLKWLDELRVTFGCGILLVHHLRKRPQGEQNRGRDSSDVFGSSVLLRWPETVMLLDEETLRVKKDRDETFGDLTQFRVIRGGLWPIGLSGSIAGLVDEVYEYVQAFGPASGSSVRGALNKRTKDVYEALRGLEMAGRVLQSAGRWRVVD